MAGKKKCQQRTKMQAQTNITVTGRRNRAAHGVIFGTPKTPGAKGE